MAQKKSSNPAMDRIKKYLDDRAKTDAQFAVCYAKEGKSINDCMAFILSEARKRAVKNTAFMTDEEVFGLAVHYYDEDDIDQEAIKREKGAADAIVATSPDSPEESEEKPESPKKKTVKKAPKTDPDSSTKVHQMSIFEMFGDDETAQ